jgi:hypothetical protein
VYIVVRGTFIESEYSMNENYKKDKTTKPQLFR